MKKLLVTTTLIVLTTANAWANDNMFLRMEIGSASSKKLGKDFRDIEESADADKSGVIAIGVGSPISRNMSFTIVGDYRPKFKVSAQDGTDIYSADLKSMGVRANVYYNWKDLGVASPYFTLGVGAVSNNLGKLSFTDGVDDYEYGKENKINLMYQFGSGVDIHVTENVIVDIGYRFSNLGKFSTSTQRTDLSDGTVDPVDSISGKLQSHDIMLGIKYKF